MIKSSYAVAAVIIAAMALYGCGSRSGDAHDGHDHGGANDHDHGAQSDDHGAHDHSHADMLMLTGYGDKFEVFVEMAPFAVGESSNIMALVSMTDNFKPLESGKITASLIVGSDGIRQVAERPVKAGNYVFTLKPVAAGKGSLIFDIESTDGKSQITIPVEVYSDGHSAFHGAENAAPDAANSISFTKAQSWRVDFATEEVVRGAFGEIIRTTAQIIPSQGDERMVTALADGLVSFPAGNVLAGKAVNMGEALFSIESSSLADNNMSIRYTEAEAEYNRAKAEYERKRELAKDKIVSERDLIIAETEFKNAEINYNNLRKNFSSGKQSVSSPIGGFIKEVLVRNGEYVAAGTPVMVVSQNRELLMQADLQPKYYSVLSSIFSANVKLLNRNEVYSIEELGGKLVSFGRSADVNNPLIPVVFQIRNSGLFLPGGFVELFIKTRTNNQALTIPNEALIEELGSYFVFVQITPELFEKRVVVKGSTDGLRSEIISGLSDGERVVSRGAILVKLAQSSEGLDPHAGHMH